LANNGGNLSNGSRAEWLPGFGIGPDYSLCNNDATHVIHISGEYALPFGSGRKFMAGQGRLVNAIVGGWNVNYIFTHQTGQPFNVGCPTATTSDFGCVANLVKLVGAAVLGAIAESRPVLGDPIHQQGVIVHASKARRLVHDWRATRELREAVGWVRKIDCSAFRHA
jgi:hypothetical protein